jgi:hypothetical protein
MELEARGDRSAFFNPIAALAARRTFPSTAGAFIVVLSIGGSLLLRADNARYTLARRDAHGSIPDCDGLRFFARRGARLFTRGTTAELCDLGPFRLGPLLAGSVTGFRARILASALRRLCRRRTACRAAWHRQTRHRDSGAWRLLLARLLARLLRPSTDLPSAGIFVTRKLEVADHPVLAFLFRG